MLIKKKVNWNSRLIETIAVNEFSFYHMNRPAGGVNLVYKYTARNMYLMSNYNYLLHCGFLWTLNAVKMKNK